MGAAGSQRMAGDSGDPPALSAILVTGACRRRSQRALSALFSGDSLLSWWAAASAVGAGWTARLGAGGR